MIIVKLQGGLGNQMFQYAAGKALALKNNTILELDMEFLLDRGPHGAKVFRDFDLDVFGMDVRRAKPSEIASFRKDNQRRLSVCERAKQWLFPSVFFAEPHFHYCPEFHNLPANTYLDGYWQSPKYFQQQESVIRDEFRFRQPILPVSERMLQFIERSVSVCLNVRRTDFLTNTYHGVCGMSYYEAAMRLMRGRLENPHFFVFSDDPEWCVENFTAPDTTVIGPEHNGAKFANKLQLMARCRHFIIPNSTYGWWAVWLCKNTPRVVIAPQQWFAGGTLDTKDLIPSEWIRLKN